MKPTLVIFDCDGVLVDSEPASNAVLRDNLERHGLNLGLQECHGLFVGKADQDVQRIAREMGANLPTGWIDTFVDETLIRMRKGIDVVAGIPELLDILAGASIPVCVASNGPVEKMQSTLGPNGLWERFQGNLFSAVSFGIAKPNPDLFLHAAKQMGVKPEGCVVIEDSLGGVIAARRAGMRCLGYVAKSDGAALDEEGAEVFGAMADVAGMLGL